MEPDVQSCFSVVVKHALDDLEVGGRLLEISDTQRMPNSTFLDAAHAFTARASHLVPADGSFDAVIVNCVLQHHLRTVTQVRAFFRLVNQYLRPGGHFISLHPSDGAIQARATDCDMSPDAPWRDFGGQGCRVEFYHNPAIYNKNANRFGLSYRFSTYKIKGRLEYLIPERHLNEQMHAHALRPVLSQTLLPFVMQHGLFRSFPLNAESADVCSLYSLLAATKDQNWVEKLMSVCSQQAYPHPNFSFRKSGSMWSCAAVLDGPQLMRAVSEERYCRLETRNEAARLLLEEMGDMSHVPPELIVHVYDFAFDDEWPTLYPSVHFSVYDTQQTVLDLSNMDVRSGDSMAVIVRVSQIAAVHPDQEQVIFTLDHDLLGIEDIITNVRVVSSNVDGILDGPSNANAASEWLDPIWS